MANNHSRYLGNSGNYFENQYSSAKDASTWKQRKFFFRLRAMCKEHGIEEHENPSGRVGFANSIDTLLGLLKEHGVDVHGNNKTFVTGVFVEEPDNTILEKDTKVRQVHIDD